MTHQGSTCDIPISSSPFQPNQCRSDGAPPTFQQVHPSHDYGEPFYQIARSHSLLGYDCTHLCQSIGHTLDFPFWCSYGNTPSPMVSLSLSLPHEVSHGSLFNQPQLDKWTVMGVLGIRTAHKVDLGCLHQSWFMLSLSLSLGILSPTIPPVSSFSAWGSDTHTCPGSYLSTCHSIGIYSSRPPVCQVSIHLSHRPLYTSVRPLRRSVIASGSKIFKMDIGLRWRSSQLTGWNWSSWSG